MPLGGSKIVRGVVPWRHREIAPRSAGLRCLIALAMVLQGSPALAAPIHELDFETRPMDAAIPLDPAIPPLEALIAVDTTEIVTPASSEPMAWQVPDDAVDPPGVGPSAGAIGAAEPSSPASEHSLREVIRSIATIHRWYAATPTRRPAPVAISSSPPYPAQNDAVSDTGLLQLILDSEMAGAAMRSIVDVRSTDGEYTEFVVLGMGDFVLELEGAAQSAVISELSSGFSAQLTYGRDEVSLLERAGNPSAASDGALTREGVNYFRLVKNLIIDLALSPLGILIWMTVVIVIVMRAALKMVQAWNASAERTSAARLSRRLRVIERRKAKKLALSQNDKVREGDGMPLVRAASE